MTHILKATIAICLGALCVSCASRKGSSTLGETKSQTTSVSRSPRVKSDADLAQAKQDAAAATAAAKAKADAELKATQKEINEAAAKAKAQTVKAHKEADRIVQESIKVREETVKVIQRADNKNTGKYHIIIGSFKVLENARTACNDAVKKNFLPSIMENEDGLYRVSIFTSDLEQTARNKVKELLEKHPEYVGVWLLVEKR